MSKLMITSAHELRRKLCSLILASTTQDIITSVALLRKCVETSLSSDELLSSTSTTAATSDACHDNIMIDPVTPIMIACDKRKAYLLMELLRMRYHYDYEELDVDADDCQYYTTLVSDAIGHPDDHTGVSIGGNTAMHLAAASGSVECLQLLRGSACPHCRNAYRSSACDDNHIDLDQFYCTCAEAGNDVNMMFIENDHNDTPLMIAVFSNQIEVLRYFVDLWDLWRRSLVSTSSKMVRCPFSQVTNKSGDSVLSLIVEYGRIDMLKMVLNEVLTDLPVSEHVELLRKELKQCDNTIQKLDRVHSRIRRNPSSSIKSESINKEIVTLKECRLLLKELFDKDLKDSDEEALLMEKQLLESLSVDEDVKLMTDSANPTLKIKQKKKNQQTKKNSPSTRVFKVDDVCEENKQYNSQQHFVTLENGHIISKADAFTSVDFESDQTSLSMYQDDIGNANIVIDALFRQRCPEAQSLCLDPATILLSTHAMAMKLSPCQLEAIISLLEGQLQNAKDAKVIHNNLHKTSQDE